MGVDRGFKRILKRLTPGSAGGIEAMQQGIGNQSQLINDKFKELIEGSENQSQLLNAKFKELIEGSENQSQLLNAKFKELIEGSKNQSQLLNAKFNELLAHARNQDKLLEEKLSTMIARQDTQVRLQREEIALLRDLLKLNSAMRDNSAIQSPPGTSEARDNAVGLQCGSRPASADDRVQDL